MKKVILLLFVLVSMYHTAFANPLSIEASIEGSWINEDKDSVVLIKQCSHQPKAFCGYLTHFMPSPNRLENRALCHFRLIGGLKPKDEMFINGYILDPETDEIYNLTAQHNQTTDTLALHIYGRLKVLGVKVKWTRTTKPTLVLPLKCTP